MAKHIYHHHEYCQKIYDNYENYDIIARAPEIDSWCLEYLNKYTGQFRQYYYELSY